MANGNNGEQPIHLARTHAPVVFQGASVAGSRRAETAIGLYDRRPRIDRLSFESWDTLDSTDLGNVVVVSPGNSLFRLVRSPDITQVVAGVPPSIDIYWRAYGEDGVVFDLGEAPEQGRRFPFIGPYAYFPAPGRYEVVAEVLPGPGSTTLDCEISHGVTPEEWASLSQGLGCRFVSAQQHILVAGVAQRVSFSTTFFAYRHILFNNVGANPIVVSVGAASFTILAGGTLTLESPVLGRHVIQMVSTLGSTVEYLLGMW